MLSLSACRVVSEDENYRNVKTIFEGVHLRLLNFSEGATVSRDNTIFEMSPDPTKNNGNVPATFPESYEHY